MGTFGSKVEPCNLPNLVKQLGDCQLPEDRNQALDYLEQIDRNLLEKKTLDGQSKIFKECEGMRLLVKVGKRLVEDIDVISVVIQVVEDVKMITPLIMDFIQFGGVDMLEKAMRIHSKDDFLAVTLPKLIKVVLAVGASASIEEIQQQGQNLLLCQKCQEIIERNKCPFSIQKITVPAPASRINRVLRFMDNFMARVDVQIAALDAVIKFCRNPDAERTAKETEIFFVVSKAAKEHKTETAIQWRAAMSFSLLASYGSELAVAVMGTQIHEWFIEVYPQLDGHRLVQQQILWFFGSLLKWQRSKKLLHKSPLVMDFFKSLVGDPLEDKKEAKKKQRQAELEKELQKQQQDALDKTGGLSKSMQTLKTSAHQTPAPGKGKTGATAQQMTSASGKKPGDNSLSGDRFPSASQSHGQSKYSSTHRDDATAEPVVEEDEEVAPALTGSMIAVAIPVQIRSFIRETQGRLYRDKGGSSSPSSGAQANKRPRKNFDEKPRFGTVSTKIFLPGEEGLLRAADEDEYGEKKADDPKWMEHLNYGDELTADAKKKKRQLLQKQQEEASNVKY